MNTVTGSILDQVINMFLVCCYMTKRSYLAKSFVSNDIIVFILYLDTIISLDNAPLLEFMRNHIRDSSCVFSMSSL